MKYVLVFILLCSIVFPSLLIRGGRESLNHPSKSIDPNYGYRTARSMKNQDTWAFAQRYVGQLCRVMGWALELFILLFGGWLIWQVECRHTDIEDLIWWLLLPAGAEFAAMAALRPLAERALKRNFDENGTRKQG